MRKTYHICLSSHEEVMHRSERDYNISFNCLAETVLNTDSRLLADGVLSTHWHCLVQTDDPAYFVHRRRYAYARYFNAFYGRQGRLGCKKAFITEINGIHRLTTALNYVNRQGLHHGLTETPFGYPYCSANAYFRKELGRPSPGNSQVMPEEKRHAYLTRNIRIPMEFRMNENGLLLREDIIDTSYVEQLYISPRNYLFQMNKMTDERTVEEQAKEKSASPIITIDLIEEGTPDFDVKQMLINEQGKVNKSWMTDLELCRLIDDYYVPLLKRGQSNPTIYACSLQERARLHDSIVQDLKRFKYAIANDKRTLVGRAGLSGKFATETQLRRCLIL